MKKVLSVIMGIMLILSFSSTALHAGEMTKGKEAGSESEEPGEMKSAADTGENDEEAAGAGEESKEEAAEEGENGEEKPAEESGH